MIFVGIDWAEHHHDGCVLDREGRVLATTRIPDGIGGCRSRTNPSSRTPATPSERVRSISPRWR